MWENNLLSLKIKVSETLNEQKRKQNGRKNKVNGDRVNWVGLFIPL